MKIVPQAPSVQAIRDLDLTVIGSGISESWFYRVFQLPRCHKLLQIMPRTVVNYATKCCNYAIKCCTFKYEQVAEIQ